MASVDVTFSKERETKNTVRFKEDAEEGQEKMGTVYLKKELLSEIDATDKVKVTVQKG